MRHALPQFADDAAAFFLPHLIQPFQSLAYPGHDDRLNLSVGSVGSGIERTGDSQNRIEVGLYRERKLRCGRLECCNVATDNLAVKHEGLPGRALQAQRNFHVAARHFLFEQPPQLHLQRIRPRREPEV